MRYFVIREAGKEPSVILWTKGQRPDKNERDYPHTAYMKDHHLDLTTISSAGYVFYNPDTQAHEIDDTASYQMDNHENDKNADDRLVIQSLSGFCLFHRDVVDEIRQEWVNRQAWLKHRDEVLARLAEAKKENGVG